MNKIEKFIYQHLLLLRRITQSVILIILILMPFLNKIGFHKIYGTVYSITIGELNIADPAMILQTTLLVSKIYIPLLLAGLVPVLIAFFLGKVFCSWMCPFNLITEYSNKLRSKIKKKGSMSRNRNPQKYIYWIVYSGILLAMLTFSMPLLTFLSMPGIISSQITSVIFAGSIGIEILIVVGVLLVEFAFSSQFWCKYVCPVGATLTLVHPQPIMQIQYDASQCTCRTDILPCNQACPLGLDPRHNGIYPYCFNCGNCVDACRTEGQALNFALITKEHHLFKEK